tara:strand:- start:93 stop:1292 length:1200 start_codon:yes stop_codon:yes gene_type:complete
MKKIIAINLNTGGSELGGAAIAAKLHSIFISKQLNEIELWRMWSENTIEIEKGLKIRNFKSICRLKKFRRFLPRRLLKLFLTSNIINELKKNKPKIVHLHNILPPFEFFRIINFCKKSGIYTVVSTHGFYETFSPNHKFNFLEELLWKLFVTYPIKKSLYLVDKFISSYPEEEEFLKTLNIKSSAISLIPNGADPIYEKKAPKEDKIKIIEKFKINTNKPILFFTGRHAPNKGIDTVIEIAKKLEIECTIIIGGKLLSQDEPEFYLKNFSSKFVKLIFTDYLSNSEQRAFYDISSLLLFPSKSDTAPLTIIEAMSRGLPVIAFNVGGIKYLLDKGAGYVVDNFSFEKFFNLVEKNLNNPSNLILKSKNSKKRQKNIFNWEKSGYKTAKIYESILEDLNK